MNYTIELLEAYEVGSAGLDLTVLIGVAKSPETPERDRVDH
jgi:hypothetical protein